VRFAAALVAACLVAVCLVAVALVLTPAAGATPESCTVLEVADGTLLVRTLPADTATTAGTLDRTVNAIGLVGGTAYGLTAAGHVVTFDRSGRRQDLGPVRGFPRVVDAAGGTVVGDRWYVRSGPLLFAVDVAAASPFYLHVIATVPLHPATLAVGVDDFDVDPVSGAIYGVAQPIPGHGVVVRIDVADGALTPAGGTTPGGAGYGSVSFGPDGALYVRQDDSRGRSIRYRVAPSGGTATVLDSGPAVHTADATGCLPASAPPPTTTTRRPPPPTTTTRPAPTTTTTRPAVTTTAPPTATTSRLAAPPPTTPAPPTPPPTTSPLPPPEDTTRPSLAAGIGTPAVTLRKQQRQFGLAVLILVIGGGAAVARTRRGRTNGTQ
jgi:hypothetical protein